MEETHNKIKETQNGNIEVKLTFKGITKVKSKLSYCLQNIKFSIKLLV